MAKKSRRARAKHRAGGKLAKRGTVENVPAAKLILEPRAAAPSVSSSPSIATMSRYQYVIPELKRIGIIAGALFLILIILTFILG